MRVLGMFIMCGKCAEARGIVDIGTPYEGEGVCVLCLYDGENRLRMPIIADFTKYDASKRTWDKPAWYLDPTLNMALKGEKEVKNGEGKEKG